jgi:hypothetical protein
VNLRHDRHLGEKEQGNMSVSRAVAGAKLRKNLAQGTGITHTHAATSAALCVSPQSMEHLMKLSRNHGTLCLFQLLQKDPKNRLGSHGVHQIKQHRFFEHMDWEALLKRSVKPPYIPRMASLSYCPIILMEPPNNQIKHNKHSIAKF